MEFNNLERALETYGNDLVEGYRNELERRGKNASRDLSNSVKYIVEKNGTSYEVSLSLLDYWKYIEYGRKPGGKFPPLGTIERWIKVKPVIPTPYNGKVPTEKQLAFLIGRKIAEEGIEPEPILHDTVEEENRTGALDMIADAFMKDCEENIDEVLVLFK